MSHACRCELQKEKKKRSLKVRGELERMRFLRKVRNTNSVKSFKKKVFRNPASGTTVLNSLGYHSVLCINTSKHTHLITCAVEIIAISPYLGGGGSLASRNKSLRGK